MDWSSFLQPINTMMNDLFGSPLLIGGMVFIFITFFSMMFLIPFEALVVIWVPTIVLIWFWIPQLQVVLGICLGFIIGLGLLKWIRR